MMTGPAQVPGPTVAPSAWASVRLIQGASKANQWQIDSSTTRAQLTVGADKACDWPVAAEQVAAIHFELFWDGRRLWIADTHEAGGVTVDGGRLTTWQPINGRVRIEFGTAVMLAECSVPAVSVPGESIDLDPTARPGQLPGAPGARSVPGDDERTTLHVRSDSPMPPMPMPMQVPAGKPHPQSDDRVPLHAAPTTISEMPEGMQPYGGPPPMPAGSGMQPPAILQAKKPVMPVPTIIAEPGRMPPGLQMPGPGGVAPARAGGMGMPTPDPGRPMHPGMGMGMPTPDPAGQAMMRPPMPMMPGAPMMTPTGRPAWMDRLGLPKTSIPPRTWGLVILTVAALMIVMFMGGGNDQPKRKSVAKPKATATATQPGATQPGATQPQPGATQPQPGATQPQPGATEPQPGATQPQPGATQPQPGATQPPPGGEGEGKGKTAETPTKPGEGEGKSKTAAAGTPGKPTAEAPPDAATEDVAGQATASQGVDLLFAGRQREALAVYDELARNHPDQPGYAAIVKILKRRLVERCKDKQPGESPCPPAN